MCACHSFLIDSGFGVVLTRFGLRRKNHQLFAMAASCQEYWQRIVDNQTLALLIDFGKQLSIDESTGRM
jgi:hypothetical protein